jgi:hypothetical protein
LRVSPYLEMPVGLVQAAVTCYGAYTAEIDEWIDLNEREAAEDTPPGLPGTPCLSGKALSPAIARELRGRGHDVEAVSGHAAREVLTDREIMALARSEQRALVTNNLRCRPGDLPRRPCGGVGAR